MTGTQVLEIINRVNVRSFPIPVLIVTSIDPDGIVKVGTQLEVDSVTTGKKGLWLDVSQTTITIDPTKATTEHVLAVTRMSIMKALSHEVDEHLKFDGAVLNNPHV